MAWKRTVFPFLFEVSISFIFLSNLPLPSMSQTEPNINVSLSNSTSVTPFIQTNATAGGTSIALSTATNTTPTTHSDPKITSRTLALTGSIQSTIYSALSFGYLTSTTTANASHVKPTSYNLVPGCGSSLDPIYSRLCDTKAAWGIVVEFFASLGFVVTIGLLVGLIAWAACGDAPHSSERELWKSVVSLLPFLIGTAGIFGLTFSFVVHLTPQTCPTRVFLFGVLFALALSSLLSRCLALRSPQVARGWGEVGVALALSTVQAIIAAQWLITLLIRDQQLCLYAQSEFVLLLTYVLCLLTVSVILSILALHRSCYTYSYSYTGGTQRRDQAQAALLCLTLLLSASIWVVWITLLIRGNWEMGRRPAWDDPVLSVALVSNGWVLLLGHGLAQAGFLCRSEAGAKEEPPGLGGQMSSSGSPCGVGCATKKKNGIYSFEHDIEKKGERNKGIVHSPYEPRFTMTEIHLGKDYTIPRPQTTNTDEPYDEYYGPQVQK